MSDEKPVNDMLTADASCGHFKDATGRTILLRGVNIAASAKTPTDQPLWKLEGFWEGAQSPELSFVNRTFNLENGSADTHLSRLKQWGFNCLRYIFTWEAIEHAGPGKYDDKFIEYTLRMLKKCKEYGFRVYMDPHQDLFSRFSGGDGAPLWALLAAGLDPRNFTATIAAHLQSEWPSPDAPDPRNFPDMMWATGYQKLACQTLNTLFWAGKDFAPKCIIDNVNIQEYLQSHFIDAVAYLARAVANFEDGALLDSCVIGWDSINEPNPGYLTTEDLGVHSKESVLRKGPMPTSFQAMRLGMGEAQTIENWIFSATGPKKSGDVTIDPQGTRVWLSTKKDEVASAKYGWKRDPSWILDTDIWALHGVWNTEDKTLLQPAYFHRSAADDTLVVDFGTDYWKPHYVRYAETIRQCHANAILFVHTPVFQIPPSMADVDLLKDRAVFSTHFYDGVTLVTKHWNWFNYDTIGFLRGKYRYQWQAVKIGEKTIRKCLREQLGVLKQDGLDCIGSFPVMMGEIGIPFDLDKRKAYEDGDYSNQLRALDASLNACDGQNALNSTIWTYCPDNTHLDGDQWNGEDLSLWSQDDQDASSHRALQQKSSLSMERSSAASSVSNLAVFQPSTPLLSDASRATLTSPYSVLDLNDGARALPAFCRPYPIACVGDIQEFEFDLRSSVFTLEVNVSSRSPANQCTEIYVPLVHYAAKPRSIASAVRDEYTTEADLELKLKGSKHDTFPFRQSRSLFAHSGRFVNATEHIDTLALEVDVTSGRWEVEGQTLKWYYNKPLGGSRIERISIRRAGGAIPSWKAMYGKPRTWSVAAADLWDGMTECLPNWCIIS